MTFEALLMVFGLAVVDSINPSAIVVTLYLLSRERHAPKVLAYVAGIFSAYVTLGLLLMLGLGSVLQLANGALENPVAYGVQLAAGTAMLIYALFAKSTPSKKRETRLPASSNLGAIFMLGVIITFVESSTALPYLAAIGVLLNAGVTMLQWLPIVLAYNVIFILPPLILLTLARLGGASLKRRLDRWREKLSRGSRETWLWVIGVIGFFLVANALGYFLDNK